MLSSSLLVQWRLENRRRQTLIAAVLAGFRRPSGGGVGSYRHLPRQSVRAVSAQPQESDVAKGQLRSNREKKKPKADKNKVKAAPAASPFASTRVPIVHPRGKGNKTGS
jgi:hypothetical protein